MGGKKASDKRWEKFNFLVENVIRDLNGSEAKLMMVYYRHARVETNKKGVAKNVFRVADAVAGELLGRAQMTIRDTRKRLIELEAIKQIRPATGGLPPKYVITERVVIPSRRMSGFQTGA